VTGRQPAPALIGSSGAAGARILSVGAHRPERIVTNDEICEFIDSSDQWIRERSGIATRRFARADETVLDLAEPAARQAIERAGLAPSDIDAILVATVSYFHAMPSAAAMVAHRIGAARAMTLDIAAACAGFCHGVSLASDMIRSGSASNVLVIGAEKLSDITDPRDRSTAFIFADGAGAVVLGPAAEPGVGPTVWGSDPGRWDAIRTGSWAEFRDGGPWPTMRMQGPAVFRWAIWEMSPVAQKALDAAGLAVEDLAAFIPHQANLRIVDQMVKQLQLPDSVAVARDITDTGNTSAASVPLAMHRMLDEQPELSGRPALLIGFGSGLSYAAQVVLLP
jgi:3-oxoacyl-[acyl-carrier-protein] synthase-3